jgi:outer membrane protein OmpA-like peptidoglycan-associated protein
MKLKNRAISNGALRLLVLLGAVVTSQASQAQFLDLLKDKASKILQDQLDKKPASAPVPAPVQSPAAESPAPTANASTAPAAGPAGLQAYQGYDFVPGDVIVFEDNFEGDEDGEFPTHWNQLDGAGAVNLVAGRKALVLTSTDYCEVSPAIKPPQYLSDAWTVEFDTYPVQGAAAPRLLMFASDTVPHKWGNWLAEIRFGSNNWSTIDVNAGEMKIQQRNPDFMQKDSFFNQWHHVAVAYKERRLKVYIDQYRVYSLADLKASPHAVAFDSSGTQSKPQVIANLRIANGAGIKLADKKFTDAKIVTHGINFDTDKATLKPESMGTLNMVFGVLQNNPEVRFDIQGHTDSSGNAAHNLTLSQQRAEAVRQQLVSMGVDASRLTFKGLGDTKPIASNATLEGRANNRRVEFVTLR